MNQENEVFNRSFTAGKKKYYFDVKKAKTGNLYLSIKEVTEGETPEKNESRRVLVFNNAIKQFGEAFAEAAGKIPAKDGVKQPAA